MVIDTQLLYASDYIESELSIDATQTNDKYVVCQIPWNNPNKTRFGFGVYTSNYNIAFGNRSSNELQLQPGTRNDGDFHKWVYQNKYCEIKDLELTRDFLYADYSNIQGRNYIRLFYGYNSVAKGKIKTFIQKRNGEEIVNLVPCYRKSDNEIGMYDLVTKTFFTNQGTGSFMKGPDVI